MTLQLRFILLLLTLLAGLLGGLWLHNHINLADTSRLRKTLQQERQTLVERLVELTGEPLRVLTTDYTQWDEMVTFVTEADPTWARVNIKSGLESHHLDAAWVLRPDLTEVYGVTRTDDPSLRPLPLSPAMLRHLTTAGRGVRCFALTSAGLLEIRGSPIRPSDLTIEMLAPSGWLFAARRWDDDYLQQLQDLLGGTVTLAEEGRSTTDAPDDIVTSHPLPDWQGGAQRWLRTSFQAPSLIRANRDIRTDLIFLCGFGVTALLAFTVATHYWVVRPLRLLGTSLEKRSAAPLAGLKQTSKEFHALGVLVEEAFQQEDDLRQIYTAFNAIDDALFITDSPNNHIIHVNSGATRLLGYVAGELWGRSLAELKVVAPEAPDEGTWLRCRDGRLVEVEAREQLLPGNGHHQMVVTVARDISDRRQLEQQRLRAQRMESLGTLAGGVAHDMNNMLTPVILMLDELQDSGQLPSPNLLASVRTSVRRGASMLRQLLTFGSGIEGERAPVDLNRLIEELGRIIASTFPKSINFETKVARKLPAVLGDATQLHQVLLNLCVNARDALPGGGFIKVTAVHVVLDSANAATWPEAKPGSYVRMEVSDNGSGIPREIIERVFDPFFTTKSADKGTGLGLSTTLGIVRGHGGTIRVKSQPGLGTCFGLLLPISPVQPAVENVSPSANIKGRNRTVLVIEDEETIRDVLKRSIERMGFKVIIASRGDEGLALCAEHQSELSLVITDLNMPGMDGLTVVRNLRTSSPALPVMVMSGRVDDSILAALKELQVAGLIDKPFGYAQVEAAIRRVLG